MQLILYTGPHCRLCHDAEQLLYQAGLSASQIEKVDITTSLELKKKYGFSIPVIQNKETGAELFWPFDLVGLVGFIEG